MERTMKGKPLSEQSTFLLFLYGRRGGGERPASLVGWNIFLVL
jgi:hypothetical protein